MRFCFGRKAAFQPFSFFPSQNRSLEQGFTLVELLLVIGILGIMGGITVLVLRPAELLKQARDSERLADMKTLSQLFTSYTTQVSELYGNPQNIYLSLPDTNPDCSSYSLPDLPSGYSYHCVSTANLKKVDGTGWIPVNFNSIPGGSPIAVLPVDPANNASYYYSFVEGGSYKLSTEMESATYRPAGDSLVTVKDNGTDVFLYEVGTNMTLATSANIVANGQIDNLVSGYSPGWDGILNGDYRPATAWSPGYNSGVSSPNIGYHAHANPSCGLNNSGCLEYIDENCAYGYCHRWLGVNQSWSTPGVSKGWTAGTKVRVRFLAKKSVADKYPYFGLYHYSISLGTNTFAGGGGTTYQLLSRTNEWTEITGEFTITSDWELLTHGVTFYIYGTGGGAEGRIWVDGVEIVYWNP
ncbi:MAG: prepilin-type N-terminal cleavage/methylation domain-containing protein [Patescibacteria group bacterium]|nr:prepilin-type N-terminal cleavage/methylation domain-containing protein [Patescibacteria group bacterium]MCL5261875.1 prepilin-type N-terminal cleavage/methylation domain-containing protein [Patescibacteria group bacterium]